MKGLVAALALGSTVVAAQEIGTEIAPVGPSSGQAPTPALEAPVGAALPPAQSLPPIGGQADVTVLRAASRGAFGIRAGFGASGSIALPARTAGSVAAPTVGVAYLATDAFKLLFDVGFGLGVTGSSTFFALNAGVGFDYLLRTPMDALRPFFHFTGLFGLGGGSTVDFTFGAQAGFGAEYFFAPAFSVNGRLLLALPMAVPGGNFSLGIFTVTPGIGATWYL
jgi:hypothetical protein